MTYFRVHTKDIAYITQQPRGLFTAIGKLVEAKTLTFMNRGIQTMPPPGSRIIPRETTFTLRWIFTGPWQKNTA